MIEAPLLCSLPKREATAVFSEALCWAVSVGFAYDGNYAIPAIAGKRTGLANGVFWIISVLENAAEPCNPSLNIPKPYATYVHPGAQLEPDILNPTWTPNNVP